MGIGSAHYAGMKQRLKEFWPKAQPYVLWGGIAVAWLVLTYYLPGTWQSGPFLLWLAMPTISSLLLSERQRKQWKYYLFLWLLTLIIQPFWTVPWIALGWGAIMIRGFVADRDS